MLLRADGGSLLIDAGFSLKEVRRLLALEGIGLEELKGVLLTHEHSDHASGAGRFLRTRGLPVASNAATAIAVRNTFGAEGVEALPEEGPSTFGPFTVRAVRVPHDSADCSGFAIEADGKRVLYATDLGSVPEALHSQGLKADFAVLESNHDRAMLWAGAYPKFLKERITGGRGHLSNDQAASAVAAWAGGRLKKVLLAHLSQKNNDPKVAVKAVEAAVRAHAGLHGYGFTVEAAPRAGPVRVAIA